ncbi:hypothetical protein ACFVL4_24285 [Bacillus subtilis]|uniref:hypothetical protein n=1 Tax=Bacillus TaxID=1386 RepID=UPI00059D59A6|nr:MULTISPECIES: hypothetical protein [Bacillus]NUF07896.1 hypothetical protein [Bacillus rugosus]
MNLFFRNIKRSINDLNTKLKYISTFITADEEKFRQASIISTSAFTLRSIFRDIRGKEADDLYKQLETINQECSRIMSEINNIKVS